MSDYMASLYKLAKRSETLYFPGHGNVIRDAPRFVQSYIRHRLGTRGIDPASARQGRGRYPDAGARDLYRPRSAPDRRGRAIRCWRIWKTW